MVVAKMYLGNLKAESYIIFKQIIR